MKQSNIEALEGIAEKIDLAALGLPDSIAAKFHRIATSLQSIIASEKSGELGGGEINETELVVKLTGIVRECDERFEKVGGSSRHWVRDFFLPYIRQHGLDVRALSQPKNTEPERG